MIDTATSHHLDYYAGTAAPGDWEDPLPISFLAIPSGQEFSCAVSANGRRGDRAAITLAREWLSADGRTLVFRWMN